MIPVVMRGRTRGAAKAAPLRNGSNFLARFLRAGVLLLPFAGTGCYSYSVIDPGQAGAGLDVRARITPVESVRIEELTGFRDRVIHGEIVSVEPAAVVLSVPTALPGGPGTSGPSRLHQRITVPSSEIVELEQRQLNRWRTFSLVGMAAAVAGYVVVSQFGDDDSDPDGDKIDPDNLVMRIRFSFP